MPRLVLNSSPQTTHPLDFKPRAPWPRHLPSIALEGVCVAGFDSRIGVLEYALTETTLTEILTETYPDLAWCENIRLHQCLLTRCPGHLKPELTSGKWRDSFRRLASFLWMADLPTDLQNIWDDKALKGGDLRPLNIFCKDDLLTQWLIELSIKKPSSAEWRQLIELGVDLRGRNVKWPAVLATATSAQLISQWQAASLPQASQRLQDQKRKLARLQWPRHVSGELEWHQDQIALKLNLRAQSPESFRQQITELQRLSDTLEWSS